MKTLLIAGILAAGPLVLSAAAQPKSVTPFQQHAALFLMKCAKCHTIGGGRRVGPDLRGAVDRHPHDWLIGFIMDPDKYLDSDPVAKSLLADNDGVRMENTHLTREQVEGLLQFIKAASDAPLPAPRTQSEAPTEALAFKVRMPNEGMHPSIPGIVVLLLILALAAFLWQVGERRGSAVAVVLALAAAYWSFGGRRYYHLLGNEQGYSPRQPIAFSHALHAGTLQISCLYCHSGAQRSDVAGVPALNVCMNCHRSVHQLAGESGTSPEIAKVLAAWDGRDGPKARTIPWVRVHHLPDFVHFSHRVHVANNIQCQECHGPVQKMTQMRQAASLSMGWCIDCHREGPGAAPAHWKRVGGPLDCSACHW